MNSEDDKSRKSKLTRKSLKSSKSKYSTWIEEDVGEEGDVLDLMSANANKKVRLTEPKADTSKSVRQEHYQLNENGQIIFDFESMKGKKRKRQDGEEEVNTDDDKTQKTQFQFGGKGIYRSLDNKSKGEASEPGSEYRSRKAAGDMKRKGKPEPYAYVPLNRQTLNKRKQAKFKGQFKNFVNAARKGADKGMRLKNKSKKQRVK